MLLLLLLLLLPLLDILYDLTARLLRTSDYYSQSGLTIPASGPLKEEEVALGKLLYR